MIRIGRMALGTVVKVKTVVIRRLSAMAFPSRPLVAVVVVLSLILEGKLAVLAAVEAVTKIMVARHSIRVMAMMVVPDALVRMVIAQVAVVAQDP